MVIEEERGADNRLSLPLQREGRDGGGLCSPGPRLQGTLINAISRCRGAGSRTAFPSLFRRHRFASRYRERSRGGIPALLDKAGSCATRAPLLFSQMWSTRTGSAHGEASMARQCSSKPRPCLRCSAPPKGREVRARAGGGVAGQSRLFLFERRLSGQQGTFLAATSALRSAARRAALNRVRVERAVRGRFFEAISVECGQAHAR